MQTPGPESKRAEAIQTYFLGDSVLYHEFLRSCCQQFPADIVQGDAACAARDWSALRVMAHNLKSILLTLGYPELHTLARTLEQSCIAGDGPQSAALWETVRSGLPRI